MTEQIENEPTRHGKLWSLLDWSFWGAGMGDTFREPLADRMLTAVPAETIAQAEQIMAEFIERRKIEKTGVTVWQEQRAELEQARARIAELEAELAKYVGAEPTIAEEMAYLSRSFHAVHQVCDEAEQQATRRENPLPVPEWVAVVRAAASGERDTYPPALPWARLMDVDDLAGFLRDLDTTMRDAARQALFTGRPQAPAVLTALEQTCSTWQLIAETQHAHNTAPGPDTETENR